MKRLSSDAPGGAITWERIQRRTTRTRSNGDKAIAFKQNGKRSLQWRNNKARRMAARIVLLLTAVCCSLVASVTSESAFDVLKALQGTWSIEIEGKPTKFQMSYGVGSNHSIVTGQFGKELSVFYLNRSEP